ncbi:antitoxin HigA-1 [Candidatus Magnetomoraceae bacterium gMMP-15]
MKMHNPPHPGEIIKGLWLEPMGISISQLSKAMGINSKTLSGIINGKRSITPEIAIRLSIALGSSPESWMGHQVSYDLWQAEKNRNKLNVTSLIVNTECA